MKDLSRIKFEELIKILPISLQHKLHQLKGLSERPDYHPEPNCYEHIRVVTQRCQGTNDPNMIFAGLLHDIFKLDTVQINKKTGYPMSPGHAEAAAREIEMNTDLESTIKLFGGDPEVVAGICRNHMRIKQFDDMRESTKDKLRELPYFNKLVQFSSMDNMLNYWYEIGKEYSTIKRVYSTKSESKVAYYKQLRDGSNIEILKQEYDKLQSLTIK